MNNKRGMEKRGDVYGSKGFQVGYHSRLARLLHLTCNVHLFLPYANVKEGECLEEKSTCQDGNEESESAADRGHLRPPHARFCGSRLGCWVCDVDRVRIHQPEAGLAVDN